MASTYVSYLFSDDILTLNDMKTRNNILSKATSRIYLRCDMILNQDEVNLPKLALSHPTGTQDIAKIRYFLQADPSKAMKLHIVLIIQSQQQMASTYDTVLVLGMRLVT